MDFKLVSKNNIGVVMTLFLVILLGQSRVFNFLIDTPLGRMMLLAFVILIAYTNKILGLIAVLFIIIGFNQNNMNMVYSYNYYEGFDVPRHTLNRTVKDKIKRKTQAVKSNQANKSAKSTSDASKTATTTSSSVAGSKTLKGGREGFCMTDRETNMLRGKQSNTIQVSNNLREQTDDVSPSDKSIFTSEFASF
jgi:hypothetical protein